MFLKILFGVLAFGLPLHGAITVFLPEPFRWWKELLLGILIITWAFIESKEFLIKKCIHIKKTEWIAIAFLAWLTFLVLLSGDVLTSGRAARYLGLGFIVFLISSRILSHQKNISEIIKFTVRGFLAGTTISVLFGLWEHFLGGYELLSNVYSPTISSWVPGQTIPLYHQTGSFIRMQGASSGPVEFGYLLFLSIVLFPLAQFRKKVFFSLIALFVLGMLLSFTRGALLATCFYFFVWWWQYKTLVSKKWFGIFITILTIIFTCVATVPSLRENVLSRSGTLDHFKKPIEVFQLGLKNPIIGDLGSVGPAARAINMRENNNDKAPIAENVLIDIFAQTGMIGVIISGWFYMGLFQKRKSQLFRYAAAVFLAANMATIFDMAPISMSFFLFFAILSSKERT